MQQMLLIGEASRTDAFLTRLGTTVANWQIHRSDSPVGHKTDAYAFVVDLDFDQHPERIAFYSKGANALYLLHSLRIQLAAVLAGVGAGAHHARFAGINALPGCLDAERWEMSALDGQNNHVIELLRNQFGVQPELVADRVGMVTPRVIAMIINEAYYTVQEGTASKEAIDLGMKLGTNYPAGPFEWLQRWGIVEVYHLLDALWLDTREERYKICPLLKTEYLKLQA